MSFKALLQEHVPLGPFLTLETGGSARFFAAVTTEAELIEGLAWAKQRGVPVFVLGGGSNLVVSDCGFDGLVLRLRLRGIVFEGASGEHESVLAAAGEPWDAFVEACIAKGLAGLECLSGIPGSVGATPVQNVGAYGQEVCDTLETVFTLDRHTWQPRAFSNAECEFGYRTSRFKTHDRDRYVITSVRFRLKHGAPSLPRSGELTQSLTGGAATLEQVREAVLVTRRKKSMLLDPGDPNRRSCGSFFLNPVVSAEQHAMLSGSGVEVPSYPQSDGSVKLAAAWLIQASGYERGHRTGNVGLSTQHTLCVVAHDGATSDEVVAFARELRDAVLKKFGIALTPEPVFVNIAW